MTAATMTRRGSLFLTFRIGDERYALAAIDIAEVLPRLRLAPVPQAPAWVAGVLAHRGALVPVLDLSMLAFGRPSLALTSTRLVLVHYRPEGEPARLLGLILEHATDTRRLDPAAFRPWPLPNPDTRYLGPAIEDPDGLTQWIQVHDLLDQGVRRVVFGHAAEGARNE